MIDTQEFLHRVLFFLFLSFLLLFLFPPSLHFFQLLPDSILLSYLAILSFLTASSFLIISYLLPFPILFAHLLPFFISDLIYSIFATRVSISFPSWLQLFLLLLLSVYSFFSSSLPISYPSPSLYCIFIISTLSSCMRV